MLGLDGFTHQELRTRFSDTRSCSRRYGEHAGRLLIVSRVVGAYMWNIGRTIDLIEVKDVDGVIGCDLNEADLTGGHQLHAETED